MKGKLEDRNVPDRCMRLVVLYSMLFLLHPLPLNYFLYFIGAQMCPTCTSRTFFSSSFLTHAETGTIADQIAHSDSDALDPKTRPAVPVLCITTSRSKEAWENPEVSQNLSAFTHYKEAINKEVQAHNIMTVKACRLVRNGRDRMLLQQAAQYTVVTVGRVDQQIGHAMKLELPRVKLKHWVPTHSMPVTRQDLGLASKERTPACCSWVPK